MRKISYILFVLFVLLLLSSCHSNKYALNTGFRNNRTSTNNTSSSKSGVNYNELARAGYKLGFDVESSDNFSLMTESACWIGVRYRSGGIDRNGVDCSGLVYAIYNNVYGARISRCSSADLYSKYCSQVSRSNLNQGNLVFFTTDNTGNRIGHSGIY